VCASLYFFNDKLVPGKCFSSSTPSLCLANNSVRAHSLVSSDFWEHIFVVRSRTWHSRVSSRWRIAEYSPLYSQVPVSSILTALCTSSGLKTTAGCAVEIEIPFPPDSLPVVSIQRER
jgi:hypothetical protein